MKLPEPIRTAVLTLLAQYLKHDRWIRKNEVLSQILETIEFAATTEKAPPPDIVDAIATMCGVPEDNSEEMLGTVDWPDMTETPSPNVYFRDWVYDIAYGTNAKRATPEKIVSSLENEGTRAKQRTHLPKGDRA